MTRKRVKIKLKHEIFFRDFMGVDHIEQLEEQIHRLLAKHERMKKEKEQAEKRLQQKETEWHQLRGQLRQYERERSELRERLQKILGHFEHLELP